jgi:lysophospholipase L1-like esterase
VLLAGYLGLELVDLTGSALQLRDTDLVCERARGAGVALIAFGITEAMIRPTNEALKVVPRRWRSPGWLDPRPYYSERRMKRAAQRLESAVRWRLKVALIRSRGGTRWGLPEMYERDLAYLIRNLQANGTETIVVVGHMGHDERFFPGSESSCAEFGEINERVARAVGAHFVDGEGVCARWDDFLADHFHPNQAGHRRIADRLLTLCNEVL